MSSEPTWTYYGLLPPLDPDPPHRCSDDDGGACDGECLRDGDSLLDDETAE